MLEFGKYCQLREMIKARVSSTMKKHSIQRGMNSFTDISVNLTCFPLNDSFYEECRPNFTKSLWAVRKYLQLIDKYPEYRNRESINGSEVPCAFPDLRYKDEEFPAENYIWKSAQRLEKLTA